MQSLNILQLGSQGTPKFAVEIHRGAESIEAPVRAKYLATP